jgi:hypothetical protein
MSHQISNTILMVRPVDFSFNEETAKDNEFQHNPAEGNVNQKANEEFEKAIKLLTKEGVNVLVIEKEPEYPAMPDAVFPNNWFATDENGNIHIFPMKTENRRAETKQLKQAVSLVQTAGFQVTDEIIWEEEFDQGAILEGTGSLIIDRINKVVFAAISERTQKRPVEIFAEKLGYEPILFQTRSSKGFPYYHTNVVMSIGEKMAVVCLDCIPNNIEKTMVQFSLERTHTVVTISKEQLEAGFCGNLLQVKDKKGKPVTVLSQTAFNSLTEAQKEKMKPFGKLLPIDIPTIEFVGGGSIRCMMAEIFLPKA